MTLDNAVTLTGMGLVVVLLAVLIGRRVYRALPVLVFYLGAQLLLAAAGLGVARFFPAASLPYWAAYDCVDALLYCWVLAGLGKNLLRYNRAPAPGLFVIVFLFLLAALPIGFLSQWTVPLRLTLMWQCVYCLAKAASVVRVAAALALIWWSSLQNLTWPDREFRVVAGLGLPSLVGLGVAILHMHGFVGGRYHWLALLPPVAQLGVLAWWAFYFAFDPGATAETQPGGAEFAVGGNRGLKSRMRYVHKVSAG